ncbi:Uncharacterised protein [uncultured archaeon]|nr:Uncharacterised protein [uncultured archaeon]
MGIRMATNNTKIGTIDGFLLLAKAHRTCAPAPVIEQVDGRHVTFSKATPALMERLSNVDGIEVVADGDRQLVSIRRH